jgi:hypothetical protein
LQRAATELMLFQGGQALISFYTNSRYLEFSRASNPFQPAEEPRSCAAPRQGYGRVA